MRPRAIEVHIGELVLEGVSPADRLRIGAAVEHELARLIREGGLGEAFSAAGSHGTIDAGSFTSGERATPTAVGGHIARSVYGGLKR